MSNTARFRSTRRPLAVKPLALLLCICLCAAVCASCSSVKDARVEGYTSYAPFSEALDTFCDKMPKLANGATVSYKCMDGWDSEWILQQPEGLPDGDPYTYEIHVTVDDESNTMYLFFVHSGGVLYPAGCGMLEDGDRLNYRNKPERGKEQCEDFVRNIYSVALDAGTTP